MINSPTPDERVVAGKLKGQEFNDSLQSVGTGVVQSPPPLIDDDNDPPDTPDNGSFAFADVHEIDDVVTQLNALVDGVRARGQRITQVTDAMTSMADDPMSTGVNDAFQQNLQMAGLHNKDMLASLETYVQAMTSARSTISGTEGANQQRFSGGAPV